MPSTEGLQPRFHSRLRRSSRQYRWCLLAQKRDQSEASFEASVKKMNEEEHKRALRRHRIDANIVSRILKLLALLLVASSCFHCNEHHFCLAIEDEDFLAEILAEEAKHEEEHARLEAEMKEMEAMRAARQQPQSSYHSNDKARAGSHPSMGRAGIHGKMPKGASLNSNFSKIESELKKKHAQQSAFQQTKQRTNDEEESEAASRKAQQIRDQREAYFEASLKKMNEEERKRALRQKRNDAKIVSRILKAASKGQHYAVLGIHNFEFQLGPFYLFHWSFGPYVLFRTKTKEIKRVYRNLARTVHPDKNKDGRAEEAFHAIEASAAILTDEKKRKEYDKRLIGNRRRKNREVVERVVSVSGRVWHGGVG
ncbi:hypothetical protein ACHAWX_000788, partial [Stephanocyclus meneghinianus]